MEIMTDKQLDKIFQMFEMILDGCKDLDDAKRKVKELRDEKKRKLNKSARISFVYEKFKKGYLHLVSF